MSMLDPDNVGNNFFALRQIERDKLKEEADELRRVLNGELESDTFRELQALQSRKSKPLTEEERLSLDVRTEDAETSPQPNLKQEEEPLSTSQPLKPQAQYLAYRGFRSEPKTLKQLAQEEACEKYRLKQLEKEAERKRQEELENLNESDESAEWTRDRYDADVAIKWAKKYTKSYRKRSTYTDNAWQRNRTLVEMAKSVQPVDWENKEDGFIQYEQQYRTEPVPLYVDKFMDMCYPPINQDFPVSVVSFVRGAFFLSWKEIDDERREFEKILKKDNMGVGLGLRCTFKGDVVAVRAGSKDVEWKRAVVKQVHKRANQIHVCLVEYGFETVVIGKEEGKSILEDHYSKSERGRVFFACRFVLDGVDPTTLAEGSPAYGLLKDSVQGVEAVVRCSRREGRAAFGRMWIRPEDELYDLAAEIKKLSGSSK